MDHQTMKLLWEYNTSFSRSAETRPQKRKDPFDSEYHSSNWAGYQTRQMLQLLYMVSMLCLLRYDEALRIMWSDIDFIMLKGQPVVKLSLPFRKTHQTGGMCRIKFALHDIVSLADGSILQISRLSISGLMKTVLGWMA